MLVLKIYHIQIYQFSYANISMCNQIQIYAFYFQGDRKLVEITILYLHYSVIDFPNTLLRMFLLISGLLNLLVLWNTAGVLVEEGPISNKLLATVGNIRETSVTDFVLRNEGTNVLLRVLFSIVLAECLRTSANFLRIRSVLFPNFGLSLLISVSSSLCLAETVSFSFPTSCEHPYHQHPLIICQVILIWSIMYVRFKEYL